jgi:hypothetical protein
MRFRFVFGPLGGLSGDIGAVFGCGLWYVLLG